MGIEDSYVYQKEVDWSLLTEGLTLPIKEQVVFGQIMGRYLEKGEAKPIRLILGGKTYNATIRNVKFQEKWNHKSDILQIRYAKNGDLARALQVVFSKSYNYLNGARQSREKGDRRIIRLPDDAKDFLAIYTTEFDDTYVLDPILSEDVIAVATYARDFSEQHIENEMNFEIDDPSVGIQVSEGVRKIRKLNKKIGDNLKQLYCYRCQICGQSIGEESILLGLTATPERMDGKSILSYFGNRIAAEIRLPEAIDRKLLCPFQYFGVTDTVDLDTLKWSAGGYDKSELTKIYTLSGAMAQRRADLVVSSLLKYVTDIDDVKGLGFCVSIEHAEFMCRYFNDHGIPSMYLTGSSPDEERKAAKQRLVTGEVRFIFVVDIYNEGVDIPEVNTVLFLRPTESLTVFLQQLGRGLRLAEDKECLTVLDFIGQANKKYNFEDKFAALLSNTTRSVTREIKDGFVSVPKGCYIQLEKKAARYILDNIRASYGNTAGLVSRVASFADDTGLELTLGNFLDYYHLDSRAVYKFTSFSRLCARADVAPDFQEALEDILTKAFSRLAVIDSRRWISFLLDLLPRLDDVDFAALPELQKRMLQMFYITIWGKAAEDWSSDEVLDNLYALSDSPVLLSELLELLRYRYEKIDFIDEPVDLGFDCPLDLHCTYTRDQLLVALDFLKPSTVREGVKWLPDKQLDVFFVTLNKADKDYSPTTMYNDYSINESLFHWQSQSTTAENSATGQRYIHHRDDDFSDNNILIVVNYDTGEVLDQFMAEESWLEDSESTDYWNYIMLNGPLVGSGYDGGAIVTDSETRTELPESEIARINEAIQK